ncbi:uncharacterized protein LOC103507810 [Diaphorina citri]|uniref:Uncharacterized protein LOC103507810 n=1 Tax=Diaphorina citri TaxID=121845 RepID=A0A3Q0IQ13_DIACI|nr:uncharacterized protein LOC103507810 [Diaphorina citri]
MVTLIHIVQWTSLFGFISSASIKLNNKTVHVDNLEDDTSRLTFENNNSSVVIEIPKDSKFILKDGSDHIIFSSKGKGSFTRNEAVHNCKKSAMCEPLISPTCLGTKLPYGFTTTSLVSDVSDQQEVQERLKRWQGLKYIPKCWAVIQSFLCALYMPKCEDNVVSVPSQEVCKLLSGPCRIVAQELSPEFNCQNGTKISSHSCKRNVSQLIRENNLNQSKPRAVNQMNQQYLPVKSFQIFIALFTQITTYLGRTFLILTNEPVFAQFDVEFQKTKEVIGDLTYPVDWVCKSFEEHCGCKIQESIRKKVPWFHIGAWAGVPLPLIIIICWIGEIDGNSVSGICFVGYNNMVHRVLFFSIPVLCSFIVADIFLCKGEFRTYYINSFHLFRNEKNLKLCPVVNAFGDTPCTLQRKPNLDYLKFHFLAMFATALVITTYWVFYTGSFVQSWAGFLKRLIRKEIEDQSIVPKYKLVRRAYAKSKKTNVADRCSIDMYETPQDPIGLNFELNSKASHGISPSWAAALPNLVLRRNALQGAGTDTNSSSSSKQNSEISYSVCRVSVESRRNSNDSSLSVQAVEVTKTVRKSRDRRGGGGSRNKRRDLRSSSTSQESFFRMTQILAQSTGAEPPVSTNKEPYLGRRTAIIGGMDDNMLLLTKQLFSQLESTQDEARSSESGSDDE